MDQKPVPTLGESPELTNWAESVFDSPTPAMYSANKADPDVQRSREFSDTFQQQIKDITKIKLPEKDSKAKVEVKKEASMKPMSAYGYNKKIIENNPNKK